MGVESLLNVMLILQIGDSVTLSLFPYYLKQPSATHWLIRLFLLKIVSTSGQIC